MLVSRKNMFALLLCSFSSIIHLAASQAVPTGGRCDRQAAYFFGNCRVRSCLLNETLLTGPSYCDVYRAYLRTPYVRCAANLPCCMLGGQCRQQCGAGERQMTQQTDCTAARTDVCCVVAGTGPAGLPGGASLTPTIANQRQGQCGTATPVQSRVVGGSVTLPANWPWMVRLVYRDNAARVCDGVLVGNDTALTVARCVAGIPADQLQIRVGDFDLGVSEPDEETVGVRNIEINRNFVVGTRGNDFAIIRLNRPVTVTQNRLPACVPDPGVPLARPLQCFVAGWGVSNIGQVSNQLRIARVRVMDTRLCNAVITSASVNSSSLGSDMFCTEPLRVNSEPCLFDDGGMLSCLDIRNRLNVVGLVAEFSCGGLPTVYTRVDNYTQLIVSRIS